MDQQEFFDALRNVKNDNAVKVRKQLEKDADGKLWSIVQTVYNYHPAIGNLNAKQQIAELAAFGGFGLLKAMMPEAEEAKAIDEEQLKIISEMEKLTQRREEIQKRIKEIQTAWCR